MTSFMPDFWREGAIKQCEGAIELGQQLLAGARPGTVLAAWLEDDIADQKLLLESLREDTP